RIREIRLSAAVSRAGRAPGGRSALLSSTSLDPIRWVAYAFDVLLNTELTLVVVLFVHADRRAEFEQFESRAVEIMKRHGGRIERRIRCSGRDDASEPDEVHIVTFPTEAAFERYRRDPDVLALASLRTGAIRETIIWKGVEAPRFGGADERGVTRSS